MDYRSMVNPTYLTAKSTVFMLAGAGNEDAKKMIAKMGMQDGLTKGDGKQSPFSETDVKALFSGVTLAIEARYASLSRILMSKKWGGLLDIACGYTPRGIFCNKAGISYRGLDVPVVAEEMQAFADEEGLGKIYFGGDATNAASLSQAADQMSGELLVSCEGLLQYLSEDEFEQLIIGIRQMLKNHGGIWVSSDMGVDYEAFATVNMSSPEAKAMYEASRKKTTGDADIYNDGISLWEKDRIRAFLESHGMKVEELPFYHGDEELVILSSVPEVWKEGFLGILESSKVWKMTLDENYVEKEKITGAKQVDNLEINYEAGDRLKCTVKGRIDTISAPALMEVFDKNFENVKSITVLADELEYISSAGLRVLMIAVKKLGEGSVKVIGANEAVKEIFETTGFDQMIIVE